MRLIVFSVVALLFLAGCGTGPGAIIDNGNKPDEDDEKTGDTADPQKPYDDEQDTPAPLDPDQGDGGADDDVDEWTVLAVLGDYQITVPRHLWAIEGDRNETRLSDGETWIHLRIAGDVCRGPTETTEYGIELRMCSPDRTLLIDGELKIEARHSQRFEMIDAILRTLHRKE